MKDLRVVINGHDVWVDAGPETDFIRREIVRTGALFEQGLLDYIRDKYPLHKRVLDIGANWGNHSLFFSKSLYHMALDCFEPNPEMFKLLCENLGPQATCHPYGLGAYEGRAVGLMEETDNAGTFTLAMNPAGDIPICPLDGHNFDDVTLMKIDVEWMERDVLMGGRQTIARCRPIIFLEGRGEAYIRHVMTALPCAYSYTSLGWLDPELVNLWELEPR